MTSRRRSLVYDAVAQDLAYRRLSFGAVELSGTEVPKPDSWIAAQAALVKEIAPTGVAGISMVAVMTTMHATMVEMLASHGEKTGEDLLRMFRILDTEPDDDTDVG
jgi:hypothetical protein